MKKTAIITDSSAYLTSEQLESFNISVLPIPIIWDNHEYKDLIDIKYDDFYSRLSTAKTLPTTSTPSLGALDAEINKFKAAGFDEIIGIFISKGISSFYENAVTYVKDIKDINIKIFDTRTTCAGIGNMVMLAGELINAGQNSETIFKALTELRESTSVRLIVDNLKFLQKTGRISSASSMVGSLLNIKPIIGMDVQNNGSGKLSVIAKERTYTKAFHHVLEDVHKLTDDENFTMRATVIDAHDATKRDQWIKGFNHEFPSFVVDNSIIGPVVGIHTGNGAVAVILAKDWKELLTKYNK